MLSPNIDETPNPGESAEKLCLRLAKQKAEKVAEEISSGLIIASDQVLACGEQILSKPGDHQKAVQQLQMTQGKQVTFYTSLCLLNVETSKLQLDMVPIHVTFRTLSNEEIDRYLKLDSPYDCAGSFKSESLGITLVKSIDCDDPNALIGLPLIKLCEMLRNEGIEII